MVAIGPSNPCWRIRLATKSLWTTTSARRVEQPAGHRDAIVVRAGHEVARPLRMLQSGRASVELALGQISVPVAAPDREVGDEMVQIGFVHDDDAGMPQRLLVDERVPGIVADVVERGVESAGIEGSGLGGLIEHVRETRFASSADSASE